MKIRKGGIFFRGRGSGLLKRCFLTFAAGQINDEDCPKILLIERMADGPKGVRSSVEYQVCKCNVET